MGKENVCGGEIEILPVEVLKEYFKGVLIVIAIEKYWEALLQLESMGIKQYKLWSLFYADNFQCKSRQIMEKEFAKLPQRLLDVEIEQDTINRTMNHLTGVHYESWQYKKYLPDTGKLLDMGCGCGQQLFHWLCKGYDAYGIDCCEWKMNFCQQKIEDFLFPQEWKARFIWGYGENLPFEDNFFDVVTCWYVLEHVDDYRKCVQEMLRVVKKGGYVFLNAPDYRDSFAGHYWIDFEKPLINHKEEFRNYLLEMGEDTELLDNELNFIQTSDIYEELHQYIESGKGDLEIINMSEEYPRSQTIIRENRLVFRPKIDIVVKKV